MTIIQIWHLSLYLTIFNIYLSDFSCIWLMVSLLVDLVSYACSINPHSTWAFFLINSVLLAAGFLVVFSLLWGAVGYMLGAFVAYHIPIAPPALIVGIFFYMISLCINLLPLLFSFRTKGSEQEIE